MTADFAYTRSVSAARPFVFACLTEPRHLAAFWGPAGTTTPVDGIVVELRPGGRFETTIVNNSVDGGIHLMRAVFDEIDPPRTLSWTETDTGMSTTISFVDVDANHTDIHIQQRHVPEVMRRVGPAGFESSLDRFEYYLLTAHRGDM